jgi:hypothetical protein
MGVHVGVLEGVGVTVLAEPPGVAVGVLVGVLVGPLVGVSVLVGLALAPPAVTTTSCGRWLAVPASFDA